MGAIRTALVEAAKAAPAATKRIRDQFDLVRYDPPRGQPKSVASMATDENAERLMGIARKGIEKGGDMWYDTRPIYDAFVSELGQKEGAHQFGRFMDFVAATSPRSTVDANIRRGSYFHHLERQGKQFAGLENSDLPKGYGHLAHKTQDHLLRDLQGGRHFEDLSRPKTSSFAENLKGNWLPVTIDSHNMRSLSKGKLDRSPSNTEYRYLEAYEKDIASALGIEPAQLQSSIWVADDTGVANTRNFSELFDEAVARTAAQQEIPKEEALSRFVRGEIPLYSLLAGTTLGQFLAPEEAEAGPVSAGADVVKQLGKAVDGWHYSKSDEALRRLDPEKYATGASARQGAERARLEGNPDITPRSYFYADGSNPQPGRVTPRPEPMVGGGPTYRAKLDGLYDLGENPLGLSGDLTNLERQIKGMGFNGYVRNGVAVSFEPTEVSRVARSRGEAEEALARASNLLDEPQLVTAEVIPSAKTEYGRWLDAQPLDVRERYTDQFVEDVLGRGKMMEGLGVKDYEIAPGYGTYKGRVNPNLVIATNTQEEAKAVADTLGYVARQEATPYVNRRGPLDGPVGVNAHMPAGTQPSLLEDLYRSTGLDATRTRLDTIDVINFDEMPDDQFIDTLDDFFKGIATDVSQYRAGGDYNPTEALWNNGGADVRAGREETLSRLRDRAEAYNRRFREQHGYADPRALAATAALSSLLAPGDDESSVLDTLLNAGATFAKYADLALDTLPRTALGATGFLGSLAAGEGLDAAIAHGRKDFGRDSLETTYDIGGAVTDATGSPVAGTVAHTLPNLLWPF